ncbi:hypothetical protein INT46_000631 [Mucor plumbeus]|uniref:Uncharacterized protein n=1 Tax=Mucor plumbeus TaxID=97098 RepID=A0A8H7QZ43_9FUNG|nr:hypothetical protein INT46_000631 [Mucor plumbeus]
MRVLRSYSARAMKRTTQSTQPYSDDSSVGHAEDKSSQQLWAPKLFCNLFDLPSNVPVNSFLIALRRYCLREPSMSRSYLKEAINDKSVDVLEIFGRV